MRLRLFSLILGLLIVGGFQHPTAAAPESLALAIIRDDVDLPQCQAWGDGKVIEGPSWEVLATALGLGASDEANSKWSTGPVASETRHFRIVFKRPIPVGTICTSAETVAILKEGRALPGKMDDDSEWQTLPAGVVRGLPKNSEVRAIRITVMQRNLPWEAERRASQFPGLWLMKGRYYCPAEFGRRTWNSVEVTKNPKDTRRAKVTEWQWLGSWPAARDVAGLVVAGIKLDAPMVSHLESSQLLHPRAAKTTDWQEVAAKQNGPLLVFDKPIAAHVMRLRVERPEKPATRVTDLPEVLPLVAIAEDQAAPTARTFTFLEKSPVALQYDMPLDGFAAIRVEDSQGRHVRRLVAEVERDRGPILEPWDLRDDANRAVPPGKYRFFGIARPPLQLTYEMTVYNAGNPPWMAPVPGGGWWMADHSPPFAVCAVKDKLFFGAGGAEFGVPLIATDLEGKKLWHDLHQGATRLTSDGRYAYIVGNEAIVRIDPENKFAKKTIHKFQYSDNVPGHAGSYLVADRSGTAAHGNSLCVSYSGASPPWIRSTVKGGEIAISKCFPKPLPRKVHETALTPNELILSAFQTMPSSTAASFGPAPKKGPLANTLILSLTHDVPVGSIVLPKGDIQVFALRAGKTLPPEFVPPDTLTDPSAPQAPSKKDDLALDVLGDLKPTRFDPQTWIPLKAIAKDRPDVAVPEAGMMTRVLVFTGPTLEQIDYSLILDRRYQNATTQARFYSLEGKATAEGGWEFLRPSTQPLSYGSPATAGYVWEKPRSLRGFMMTRPMQWAGYAVDVWNGDDDAKIDEKSFQKDELWRQVHLHRQTRNHIKFSWHTNRVILGDFDEILSVRAVRIRVVEPPNGAGYTARPMMSGGFESFLAFEPIGKDPELPTNLAQRVTVLDLPQDDDGTATVKAHLPLPNPAALAFDAAGKLYASCDEGIVRLATLNTADLASRVTVVPRAIAGKPRALAFDREGKLFALDGKMQRVRVFDPQSGKLLREFGKAGGGLGPYDPNELSVPSAMAFDANEKLWIVEQHFQPKRISRWSKTGEVEKQLFGPTHYGGGGMLDPGDKTVINHLGMKFRIDYASRTWKLESRLAMYGGGYFLPDRVTYVDKKRYLIGDRSVVTPFGDAGPTSVICEERNGVAVPVVATGVLGDWKEFPKNAALQQHAASINPAHTAFVWSDRNGDSVVQMDEVQLLRGISVQRAPYIGDDLSLNFSRAQVGSRLRATNVGPWRKGNGSGTASSGDDRVPLYDVALLESIPELTDEVQVNLRGETFVSAHKLLDATGKRLWHYPDNYRGVQASNQVPWGFYNRPPGVVCGSFGLIGQFELGDERIFCVGGNNGDYFAFTHDGLLAAALVGGPRGYGRRFFSMADCEPGKTDLSDLRKTVEDFHGHVTRAEDGKVYAIAGKNHVTLMRVDGLEKMKRFEGTVDVTRADLDRTQQWLATKSRMERFLDTDGAKQYRVGYARKKLTIDGDVLTDWPEVEWMTVHTAKNATGKISQHTQARLAFDSENLYIGGTTIDHSPLVNSANDPAVLFQHGDALDLHLGLNPQAVIDRNDAVPGDLRILISSRGDSTVAMLYRYAADPQAPAPPKDLARLFKSPVAETQVSEIREMKDVRVAILRTNQGWTVEAAIPWKSLGAKPPAKSITLRGDVGVLESDQNGVTTVARYYWSNKRQVVMGDQPAEARVIPSLWGEFEFVIPDLVDSLLDP